jgi:hypothetical protein
MQEREWGKLDEGGMVVWHVGEESGGYHQGKCLEVVQANVQPV